MRKNNVEEDVFEKFLYEALRCDKKTCHCYCHRYQFGEFCLNLSAGMYVLSNKYIKMILTLKEIVKSEPKSRKVSKIDNFEKISRPGDSIQW